MSDQQPAPAQLRVLRDREGRRDRVREYKIFLDGHQKAVIKAGAEVSLPLEPGRHTLRLKLDWLGSEEVGFATGAGETVQFRCAPNGSSAATTRDIVLGTIGRKPWIRLSRSDA